MSGAARGADLDRLRDQYLRPTPDRRVDQKLMALLADEVVGRIEATRVLELGVGDQVWTPRLCQQVPEVVTIDGSRQLLDVMRATVSAPGWTPVHTMFEDYRPETRFDSVLATFVLEHVADPFLILQLARDEWLEPGGQIHVAVPHALSLHRRLAVTMGISAHVAEPGPADRALEHTHCFTHVEMEQLMVRAGFRVIEKAGFNCKAVPNADMVHLTDAQLVGLFWLGHELPIDYAATIYLRGERG